MSEDNNNLPEKPKNEGERWSEEVEVAANDLVDYVKKLIEQGNVRRLIIRMPDGRVILEVPLTPAVAVGGVVTLFAPLFAALGALAAIVAQVKIEVVRVVMDEDGEDEDGGDSGGKQKIDIAGDDE